MTRRVLIIIVACSFFHSAEAAKPSYAEGTLANGMHVIVATGNTHSSTTIEVTLPMRLVFGYEKSWQAVTENWRSSSSLRIPYSLPSLTSPVLVLRTSLEEDPMALPELITALKETAWHRTNPDRDDARIPSARWFYGSQTGSENPPQPNDIILAVNGTQNIDALWELTKSAGGDWTRKATIYRAPPTDSLPRQWYRHRASESAEIVMFQPAPITMTPQDAALRAMVNDERLTRYLYRSLTRGENNASDCVVGLYPPLAPQWLWCVVTGPAEQTRAMMHDINAAWVELIASPFISARTTGEEPPKSQDRKLIDYCMARIYQNPTAPIDSADFRHALQASVLPEQWTFLITTDTTRCTLPENFLYRNW